METSNWALGAGPTLMDNGSLPSALKRNRSNSPAQSRSGLLLQSASFQSALQELGERHERELQLACEQLQEKLWHQNQELEELRSVNGGAWSVNGASLASPADVVIDPPSRRPSLGSEKKKHVRWRSRSDSTIGGGKRANSPAYGSNSMQLLSEDLALIKGWTKHAEAMRSISESPAIIKLRSDVLTNMINKQGFDTLCSLMIVGNAALMGATVDWNVKNYRELEAPYEFRVLDRVFTAWFLLELLMRILGEGLIFFLAKENWAWNLFDFIVVMSDIVATCVELTSSEAKSAVTGNVSTMRLLRVLRITRALRIVRLFRFFRELRMMVFSVLKSGASLAWSVALFFLDVFLFAVFLTQQVTEHFRDQEMEAATEANPSLFEFFGSVNKAVYTLFLSVSGGISWVEVSTPLFSTHWTNGAVFIFFIVFTFYALTNIITGIFVDTAIQSAQSDRDEVIQTQLHTRHSTLQQMRDLFLEADVRNTGTITLEDFETHLRDARVRAHLTALGLQLDEARGLFRLLDMNKSGTLSVDEFIFGCMRLKGNARSIDLATLMYENKKMYTMMSSFFDYAEGEFEKVATTMNKIWVHGGLGHHFLRGHESSFETDSPAASSVVSPDMARIAALWRLEMKQEGKQFMAL